ncbi:tetraacyldisaccharide 4'-kinase [Snuella sedimenti]|uniref:Tetraacyldisaccharide 4'-kinase n=1 Tax=Snuella sedimenti TaxID=2798802 RepID=A0A8J7LUD7_9FLAO|nr:tetraacyldisaccharide 4'-kinase [Snuella sedimenti]MBJ6369630.1 tetraacyldisaccharide 4'-kinase [Snuella sedimenti]
MKFYRKIFFPIVPVYYSVTWLRNKLYDLNIKSSVSYDFPVICVGNLSVGGTGKTPMIEYLIRLLKDKYLVATLSRGYKRKTKGFKLAGIDDTAATLGDEPFQFYNKFKDAILVSVDEKRVNGIKQLTALANPPEIILLDDAFQHRKVNAGFNILLTTYNELYTKDFVLPAGNLRESRNGAKRADVIVVTKCPKCITDAIKSEILKQINPGAHQTVFFSSIQYASEVESGAGALSVESLPAFTLVTGIAKPEPLVQFLEGKSLEFDHLNFKDHYDFSKEDVENIAKRDLIITTEKDYMRLKQYTVLKDKLYYLPIRATIDNASDFNQLVKNFVGLKF